MELEGVRQPFRQTKSSLLDSNDQYTIFCMMWMICWTCMTDTGLKLIQINLSYGCVLFFLRKFKSVLCIKENLICKERFSECFLGHLSFCVKKMIELFPFIDWIKKYMFEKLKITWLWVLVTIYQKYMDFCPNYNLPKIKSKGKTKVYLSKDNKFRG